VQIAYTLTPFVLHPADKKNAPQTDIVPQIFGSVRQAAPAGRLPSFERFFEWSRASTSSPQLKFVKTVTNLGPTHFDKYEALDARHLGTSTLTLYETHSGVSTQHSNSSNNNGVLSAGSTTDERDFERLQEQLSAAQE
jgi:hypothetical protein